MHRAHSIVIPLLVVSAIAPVRAQERKAATPAPAARPKAAEMATAAMKGGSAAQARTPDFKVVFWLGEKGLRHQAYDVRRGQYTRAVDDWVNERTFDASGFAQPGRLAVVRDVYLDDEVGQTGREKLASAITRHERRILGVSRGASHRPADRRYRLFRLNDRPENDHAFRPISPRYRPGRSSSLAEPPPFPFPYPRPHP